MKIWNPLGFLANQFIGTLAEQALSIWLATHAFALGQGFAGAGRVYLIQQLGGFCGYLVTRFTTKISHSALILLANLLFFVTSCFFNFLPSLIVVFAFGLSRAIQRPTSHARCIEGIHQQKSRNRLNVWFMIIFQVAALSGLLLGTLQNLLSKDGLGLFLVACSALVFVLDLLPQPHRSQESTKEYSPMSKSFAIESKLRPFLIQSLGALAFGFIYGLNVYLLPLTGRYQMNTRLFQVVETGMILTIIVISLWIDRTLRQSESSLSSKNRWAFYYFIVGVIYLGCFACDQALIFIVSLMVSSAMDTLASYHHLSHLQEVTPTGQLRLTLASRQFYRNLAKLGVPSLLATCLNFIAPDTIWLICGVGLIAVGGAVQIMDAMVRLQNAADSKSSCS